jgi:hypothetical protein
MSRPSESASSGLSKEAPSASPGSTGYAALARRISGWTANLLATAIVLVAGLAIGRQVIGWWREGEIAGRSGIASRADGPSAANDGTRSVPTTLNGGTQGVPALPDELRLSSARGPLEIVHFTGDRFAALARLRNACKSLAERHDQPALDPELVLAPDRGPGEARFLARLAIGRPVEQTEDLDLYQPPGELAMVVAASRGPGRRIAAWGFALPTGDGQWSCYTFAPSR